MRIRYLCYVILELLPEDLIQLFLVLGDMYPILARLGQEPASALHQLNMMLSQGHHENELHLGQWLATEDCMDLKQLVDGKKVTIMPGEDHDINIFFPSKIALRDRSQSLSVSYKVEIDFSHRPVECKKLTDLIIGWAGHEVINESVSDKVFLSNGYPVFISATGVPCSLSMRKDRTVYVSRQDHRCR